MSDVPPEVISDIFTRLPVKSLLRFRCISKPFCALIDSPVFIKSHLHHSLISNSHRTIITSGPKIYSTDFDSLHKPILLTQFLGIKVVGSCNGLLCVLLDNHVFLCNPWTRKLKKLPVSGNPLSAFASQNVAYNLGYDNVNDDYKVVRIALFEDEVEYEVEVYSMKLNSWRKIKGFPYSRLLSRHTSVLISGRLHWAVVITTSEVENGMLVVSDDIQIASFDLASEEYHVVPQPPFSDMNCFVNVAELGGKLCVLCNYYMKYTDIWVMDHYGVKDSWTKILSISEHLDRAKLEYLRAFAYSKDEKQVLLEKRGGQLLWYDLKLKTVKRIPRIPKFSDAYISHASLVKLPGGETIDVTQGESKIRRRPRSDDFLSKGFSLKL